MHVVRSLSLVILVLSPVLAMLPPRQQVRVEGTVTRFGTGQPVSGARVSIARPADLPMILRDGQLTPSLFSALPNGTLSDAIRSTFTDASGRFFLQGLSAAEYLVHVQADGYLSWQSHFELDPGDVTRALSISLAGLATVSGRILDGAGRSVVNVPVQLLSTSYRSDGRRSYESAGTALTNDRGEYRMYWVAAGRYYLLAGRPSQGANPLAEAMTSSLRRVTASGSPLPPILGYTFYPGVTDWSGAQTLDLQPGADLRIDLSLATRPQTYSIRGTVVDSRTGLPPSAAIVLVTPALPGLDSSGACFDCPAGDYNPVTGAFQIRSLVAGTYTVMAAVDDPELAGQRGPVTRSTAELVVTIGTSDLESITLPVVPGRSISGRFRFEGRIPVNNAINTFRIVLSPVVGGDRKFLSDFPFSSSLSAQVNNDGTFRLSNVPAGDYRVEVNAGPLRLPFAGDAYLKEVRFDGADVLMSPLHVSPASRGALEVIAASGAGNIEGVVASGGRPLARAQLVMVPDRARHRPDLYRSVETDGSGRFSIYSVEPGDYRVLAWEQIELYSWFDPAILQQFETRGTPVHVTAGSTHDLSLSGILPEKVR